VLKIREKEHPQEIFQIFFIIPR